MTQTSYRPLIYYRHCVFRVIHAAINEWLHWEIIHKAPTGGIRDFFIKSTAVWCMFWGQTIRTSWNPKLRLWRKVVLTEEWKMPNGDLWQNYLNQKICAYTISRHTQSDCSMFSWTYAGWVANHAFRGENRAFFDRIMFEFQLLWTTCM